jgi:hypothetical protein
LASGKLNPMNSAGTPTSSSIGRRLNQSSVTTVATRVSIVSRYQTHRRHPRPCGRWHSSRRPTCRRA